MTWGLVLSTPLPPVTRLSSLEPGPPESAMLLSSPFSHVFLITISWPILILDPSPFLLLPMPTLSALLTSPRPPCLTYSFP